MWCATPLPEGVHSQLWFADGYNLSLREHLVRAPVIELLHSVLSNKPGLHPVGQRGAARNYRGLQGVSHFDALLVNDDGVLAYGIYLAHPLTARATAQVTTLAREGRPFLVAADRPARVQTLLRWRAEKAPELDARIMTSLPIGILA